MKLKGIALLLSLLLISQLSSAQNNEHNDTVHIHKLIVKNLRHEGKYNVSYLTSKKVFQSFDFADPTGLDTSSEKIWKHPLWKAFLSNVDTAKVYDYALKSGDAFWFQKQRQMQAQTVVFAPVLISPDGNRALVITRIISRDSGSYIAWYLEKENTKWMIRETQTIAMMN